VSVGGTTVKRGSEGEARTETSILKMARVDIELNPIYAYLKTTQEILNFSEVDILGGSPLKSPTPSLLLKKATL